jgi:pimeloyl-ACP methyl ester carboxylesterase
MGYNWLRGNADSGIKTAKRISALMKRYQDQGFQCEKVILVTHSMGGLVARAVIHL